MSSSTPASDNLPSVKDAPVQSLFSRLRDVYRTDNVFRWLVHWTPVLVLFLTGLWVWMSFEIGSHWKIAFDILIGAQSPDAVSKGYPAAVVIAATGYFLLPALIGVAVTAAVSVFARLPRLPRGR